MTDETEKKHRIISKTPLPGSAILFSVEISDAEFTHHFKKVLRRIRGNKEFPGFRKGRAPDNIIINAQGEMSVLEEGAREALGGIIPKIISEEQCEIVTEPEISITKIVRGNPLSFNLKLTLMPKVKLPDYNSIAKKHGKGREVSEVTDKEVSEAIEKIRREFHARKNTGADEAKKSEEELPLFNNSFVRSLGDFKDTVDFEAKLRADLSEDKTRMARDKNRATILDAIENETEIDTPEPLVLYELALMVAEFSDTLLGIGCSLPKYLNSVKKTIDEIRKEWKNPAEKRARLRLIIRQIAKAENIKPTVEDIERETKHILEHRKDANPRGVRNYVEEILTYEKVLEFLESQKTE